ncbi:MAG: phosphopantetheine-binding protein [Planctomycetota bacterium]
MDRDEIYTKVQDVLVEALSVDEDEVSPTATVFGDLGAESIDVLDIKFQLEQTFGFKIADGEMFPEGVMQDPAYVQDGRVTDEGLTVLSERMPHFDFSSLQDDPKVERVREIFTVETLVRFVQGKLAAAA